ncbi:hypothetical protein CRH01_19570 [Chryseobacterium rhizosphaerae]|nr:hypothetical protein CRH01_19570 [Chryseobacterium rhizosphaerae]
MVTILKKNIRKVEIKKNKKRTGYRYTGFPSISSDIKFNPSRTIRVLPEAHTILKKSKKVEYLIIPAYVLNKNIKKILIPIITKIFSLKYSIKLIFT